MSTLKDELDENSNQYFERAKELITFFFQRLDSSQMDLFMVVTRGPFYG